MKRYLAFAGMDYYPDGGWKDFVGDFEHADDARKAAKDRAGFRGSMSWWHVVDTDTKEIVEQG